MKLDTVDMLLVEGLCDVFEVFKDRECVNMSFFEEYVSQTTSNYSCSHYDEHTDKWVDEAGVSIYGHSGHCDVHTDQN